MHSANEIIYEATALPVEERNRVVDSLLKSLHAPDPANDIAWAAKATERLQELRSGRAQGVPGDEVFARIRQRFSRRHDALTSPAGFEA